MKLLVIAILILGVTSNVMAADIGLIGAQAWTKDDDVGNPVGYGIFITDPVSEQFRIHLEYRHFRHQTEALGWTNWWLPEQVDPVLLKSILTLDSFDADVLMRVWERSGVGLLLGPGISMNRFKLNRSSVEVNPPYNDHKVTRLGLAFATRLSTGSILAGSFRFNLTFKVKHVFADNTMQNNSWNPFTNGLGIYELSLGVAYNFH